MYYLSRFHDFIVDDLLCDHITSDSPCDLSPNWPLFARGLIRRGIDVCFPPLALAKEKINLPNTQRHILSQMEIRRPRAIELLKCIRRLHNPRRDKRSDPVTNGVVTLLHRPSNRARNLCFVRSIPDNRPSTGRWQSEVQPKRLCDSDGIRFTIKSASRSSKNMLDLPFSPYCPLNWGDQDYNNCQ